MGRREYEEVCRGRDGEGVWIRMERGGGGKERGYEEVWMGKRRRAEYTEIWRGRERQRGGMERSGEEGTRGVWRGTEKMKEREYGEVWRERNERDYGEVWRENEGEGVWRGMERKEGEGVWRGMERKEVEGVWRGMERKEVEGVWRGMERKEGEGVWRGMERKEVEGVWRGMERKEVEGVWRGMERKEGEGVWRGMERKEVEGVWRGMERKEVEGVWRGMERKEGEGVWRGMERKEGEGVCRCLERKEGEGVWRGMDRKEGEGVWRGMERKKFNEFLVHKIEEIRRSFDPDRPIATNPVEFSGPAFAEFQLVTEDFVKIVLQEMPKKSCDLDPIPTSVLYDCLDEIIPIVTSIMNKSLSSGMLPQCFKHALVKPLLKKANLDPNCLKHYRPVSNLPFLSKVLERIVLKQFLQHLQSHAF